MPQADAEDAPVIDQEEDGQNHAGPQVAQHNHRLRGDAQGGEVPVEQPQAAPQGAGDEDAQDGQAGGFLFRLGGVGGGGVLFHGNTPFSLGVGLG